jgi:hypothetical protein
MTSEYLDYLIEVAGNECIKCGTSEGLFMHHIKPVNMGGTDDPENLIPVCRSCHFKIEDWKTRKELFRSGMGELPHMVAKVSHMGDKLIIIIPKDFHRQVKPLLGKQTAVFLKEALE